MFAVLAGLGLSAALSARRQSPAISGRPLAAQSSFRGETTRDYNQRIQQLLGQPGTRGSSVFGSDYQIGPEDLLEISVLEAPELNRTVRVSADGEISLALLGTVRAAGLTSRELEVVLETLLRRSYMKTPHVSVFVQEMRSHPVSVFGAVEKPGVFQIRGPKTLIEVLSMAQGLAADAGDTVIVMRHAGDPAVLAAGASPGAKSAAATDPPPPVAPAEPGQGRVAAGAASDARSIEINLKDLLDSSSRRYNVLVYPGDDVKVTRAGIVYVVGEVRKPGGFLLKTNENISVLQALALSEGLTPDAAGKHARIVMTSGMNGSRKEIALDLDRILAGKAPDPLLHPRDILFVPSSSRKATVHAVYRSAEGIAAAVSGAAVYRW